VTALVELLAYAGDDLSYFEDAVATEAYLQTARMRVSVKRHARLVDYRLHDGCAARGWVCLDVSAPVDLTSEQIGFAAAGNAPVGRAPVLDASAANAAGYPLYAPLAPPGTPIVLRPAHGAIEIWSWGETDSHLVVGATRAVLVDGTSEPTSDGRVLELVVGDVLLFEETHNPLSSGLGPADPSHRQAVRLTRVERLYDPLYDQTLLGVEWGVEDALRFELAVKASGRDCAQACANALLVTNGRAVDELFDPSLPSLGQGPLTFSVPFPDPRAVAAQQAQRLAGLFDDWREWLEQMSVRAALGMPLDQSEFDALRDQFGPAVLREMGLSDNEEHVSGDPVEQAAGLCELLARGKRLLAGPIRRAGALAQLARSGVPLNSTMLDELDADWGLSVADSLRPDRPGTWGSACAAMTQDPRAALPVVELTSTGSVTQLWEAALDLIDVGSTTPSVVADVDDSGSTTLRVSPPPDPGAEVFAHYLVGNGTSGNVVAESINAVLWVGPTGGETALGPVLTVRNPLPTSGAAEPEAVSEAKLAIPGSYLLSQGRALTAEDYANLAEGIPGVRRAVAEIRFSGTRYLVEVAIQPTIGEFPDSALVDSVGSALCASRRIGHTVTVGGPRLRPLEIHLDVNLEGTAFRRSVYGDLMRLLSSGWLASGAPALYNPAVLDFGQTIYASQILAAVQQVGGVASVALTRFGFVGDPITALVPGTLALGALEMGQLENDPSTPSRGYAIVTLRGGR
jgi:predicted phage baseplate assembly protein